MSQPVESEPEFSPPPPLVADGYVLCREVEDIDREARSKGGVIVPVLYRITGDKDHDTLFMARAEVCGAGKLTDQCGRRARVERDPPTVAAGELLMMNLYNVSYRVHRLGRPLYLAQYQFVCATLDPETFHVKPVSYYVLVKDNDDWAQRTMTGGKIWLADGETARTDDVGHEQGIQAEYGEVVEVGPGGWHEGIFVTPRCKPGELVLYDKSHSTLPVNIRGQRRTLVASHQLLLVEKAAA